MNKFFMTTAISMLCASTASFAASQEDSIKEINTSAVLSYSFSASKTCDECEETFCLNTKDLDEKKCVECNDPVCPNNKDATKKLHAKPLQEDFTVVSLKDLQEEEIYMFLAGVAPENMAISFDEGTAIPLKLAVTGNVLCLDTEEEGKPLMVAQTMFVRNVQGNFFFSNDLIKWKPAEAFFTGELSLGILPNEQGDLELQINFDLNS